MKTTDTKERLLQAAMKLVSEKGYLGATTREIAQEAGVTELTLFRRFGSKEKLFEGMLERYTFLPKLKELLPELEGLSYEDALELIATRFLLTLKERKAMVRIMYSEVTVYPEKIRRVYSKFIDNMRATLAGYFEDLKKRGIVGNISSEMAARVFLGILFSYFRSEEILRTTGMRKKSMKKNVREMIELFTYGTIKRNGTIDRGEKTI